MRLLFTCCLASGLILSEANAQSAPASVRPILEGVREQADGSFIAYFGYLNENSVEVSIPVGDDNRFSPSPSDRGQTTTFSPGRSTYYPGSPIAIPFVSGNQVWTLEGPNGRRRTSTASPNSKRLNASPSVAIAFPASEALFTTQDTVEVLIDARDRDLSGYAGISSVEILANGNLLGEAVPTSVADQYKFEILPSLLEVGPLVLTARAVDVEGKDKVSNEVALTINEESGVGSEFSCDDCFFTCYYDNSSVSQVSLYFEQDSVVMSNIETEVNGSILRLEPNLFAVSDAYNADHSINIYPSKILISEPDEILEDNQLVTKAYVDSKTFGGGTTADLTQVFLSTIGEEINGVAERNINLIANSESTGTSKLNLDADLGPKLSHEVSDSAKRGELLVGSEAVQISFSEADDSSVLLLGSNASIFPSAVKYSSGFSPYDQTGRVFAERGYVNDMISSNLNLNENSLSLSGKTLTLTLPNGQVTTQDLSTLAVGSGSSLFAPEDSSISVVEVASASIVRSDANLGLGISNPDERLEVAGAIVIGADVRSEPKEGAIRYNTTEQDFQGFDGANWKSLTVSEDARIELTQIENWTAAFDWGDHSTVGYLKAADLGLESGESIVTSDASGSVVINTGVEEDDPVGLQVAGHVEIEGDLKVAGLTRKGDVFMGQFGRGDDVSAR